MQGVIVGDCTLYLCTILSLKALKEAMRKLGRKYKDVIPYILFGVLTTLVNIIVYWIFAHPLHLHVMISTIVAWVASVLFAYITNRIWVFHSTATTSVAILKEVIAFFSCRLATGVLDWVCMYVFVDLLAWNDLLVKCGANVLVIVLNYVASKVLIFRK